MTTTAAACTHPRPPVDLKPWPGESFSVGMCPDCLSHVSVPDPQAMKLAALFRNAGVMYWQLQRVSDITWEYAAKVTDTTLASEQTRALVIEMLKAPAIGEVASA